MKYDAKTLFIDLEMSPNIGYAYDKYETTLISIDHYSHIQCAAFKWGHKDKVEVYAQSDFPEWKKDRFDDSRLVEILLKTVDSADIVVAHNAKKFDIKKLNTRAIVNNFDPIRKPIVVDTLQVARTHFGFTGNSLDDLGTQLGLGSKVEKSYKGLWKLCMSGDKSAWKDMKEYNIGDIVLLERLYQKFLPWINPFPRVKMDNGKCPKCSSSNFKRNGWKYTRHAETQRYQCLGCGDPNIYGLTTIRK